MSFARVRSRRIRFDRFDIIRGEDDDKGATEIARYIADGHVVAAELRVPSFLDDGYRVLARWVAEA